jgi:uncharacterized protein
MAKSGALNRCLVDTGILYALADKDDSWHALAVAFISGFRGRLITPSAVIPEVCYLLNTYLNPEAEIAFVRSLASHEITIEHFTDRDLARIHELLSLYRDANIGFVDAACVAVAERLGIAGIATTDRRHFSLVRPKHVPAFDLLP